MFRGIDALLQAQALDPLLGSDAVEMLAILLLFAPFFALSAVIESSVFTRQRGVDRFSGGWADTEIQYALWNANALSYMLLSTCFITLWIVSR